MHFLFLQENGKKKRENEKGKNINFLFFLCEWNCRGFGKQFAGKRGEILKVLGKKVEILNTRGGNGRKNQNGWGAKRWTL